MFRPHQSQGKREKWFVQKSGDEVGQRVAELAYAHQSELREEYTVNDLKACQMWCSFPLSSSHQKHRYRSIRRSKSSKISHQ